MKNLLDLIKELYGPKALSRTLGTRTNVVRIPSSSLNRYLKSSLNIEGASDEAILDAYGEMSKLVVDVPRMNDSEKLIYEGNLARLNNAIKSRNLDTRTLSEQLEQVNKKLEQARKELEQTVKPDVNNILTDYAQAQKAYQLAQKSGYVRATARQIMREDILSKKLKLPKKVENEILSGLGEPIDAFRKAYGEDALEQLDSLGPVLGQFKTEVDAAKIARKQFNFQPKKIEAPETTTIKEAKKAEQEYGLNPETAEVVDMPEKSLMDKIKNIFTRKKVEPAEVKNIRSEIDKRKSIDELIDEYNKNQDRMSLTDEEGGTLITYDDFNKLQNRNKEIADALENKGISSKIEEKVKPEGIVIPFKKKITEPEEKADGGSIGLDYLMGFDNRLKYERGGKVKTILDLIAKTNKELKGKKSMETVNPKTGEVTIPKESIKTARTTADIEKEIDELNSSPIDSIEKKRKYNELHLEFINSLDPRRSNKNLDYRRKTLDTENRLILKAEEKGLDFDTFEELRKGLYDSRKQKTLNFIKTGKVDLEPLKPVTTFEEAQGRFKTAAKAADEIFPDYTQPKTAANTLAEVMAEQKYKKTFDQLSGDQQSELYEEAYNYITSINRLPKQSPKVIPEQVLEAEMNRVLNQYDKSMFIKNEFGAVDITNEQNKKMMAELLRRDHPELYNQIYNLGEDLSQKQILDEFDITGRKPNKDGGLNHLLGF